MFSVGKKLKDSEYRYTVYYNGFNTLTTWRQVPAHLGITGVVDYIEFLRAGYPSFKIRSLPPLLGTHQPELVVYFTDEADAVKLAAFCTDKEVA